MDKIPVLDAKFLPEFFKDFFSTPYTASWLGIYMPNLYDVREFILANPVSLDAEFINAAFLDFDEKPFIDGFDERIPPDKIKGLVFHLLCNFFRISEFMEERGEVFYLEIRFQLPFIHKSRFSGEKKRGFIPDRKTRHESFFRKNYTGRFLVVQQGFDAAMFQKEQDIFREIELNNNLIFDGTAVNCFLQYPSPLQLYWDAALEEILTQKRY